MWLRRAASCCCLLIFSICSSQALTLEPEEFWRSFRAQNPLFLQDLAVSPFDADGHRLLLLSEPPPHIGKILKDVLSRVFKDAYVDHQVYKHPIGFDGWVKDVVVTLRYSAEGKNKFDRDVAGLHVELFGTDYKASYSTLETEVWADRLPIRRKFGPPNLEVNAASLNSWLFDIPVRFVDRTAEANKPASASDIFVTLGEIFSRRQTGVFSATQDEGLVVLVLDRATQLNAKKAKLRQFFLDTDVIVGAVAPRDNASTLLAIVGRKRDTPLSEMPPLRTETVLTLAATREQDLAQS
jgi:hypothetical protein